MHQMHTNTTQPGKGQSAQGVQSITKIRQCFGQNRVKPAPHPWCARACRWFNAAFVCSADLPFPWLLTTAHHAKLGFALLGFCYCLWVLVRTLGQINSWQNSDLLGNDAITLLQILLLVVLKPV